MSIRLGVNQSAVSLCGASVESVVYVMLTFLYETMWYIMFRYVINTAMYIWDLSTYVCDYFWGTYESFMHPIFFLKYGCDTSRLGGGNLQE